jgi:hypothetical protein
MDDPHLEQLMTDDLNNMDTLANIIEGDEELRRELLLINEEEEEEHNDNTVQGGNDPPPAPPPQPSIKANLLLWGQCQRQRHLLHLSLLFLIVSCIRRSLRLVGLSLSSFLMM